MKLDGAKMIFVFGVALLIFVGWFVFGKYTSAQVGLESDLAFMAKGVNRDFVIIPDMDMDTLLGIEKFSRYSELDKRNLFSKFAPKKNIMQQPIVQEVKPVVKSTMKPIEKKPVIETVVVPEAPKTEYFYRGTMMLDGEKAYFIEQENPYKTYFLKENDMTTDIVILEVARYGVTIKDINGNIHELSIKKE